MTIFKIAEIAVAALCMGGQLADAITSQIAFSKGYVEGAGDWAQAIAGQNRVGLFMVKVVAGAVGAAAALYIPTNYGHYIGMCFAGPGAVIGFKQAYANLKAMKLI